MPIQLFAINASRELGKSIASFTNEIKLAEHEERAFEDGEHKIRVLESVRGRHVFLIHSLFGDEEQTVNDKICRLFFFIGALKDAAADKITVIIPYFAYARKDSKTKSRDPITMRYMAQLIESVGATQLVTMDIHNLAAFQNAFRIPTLHLSASVLFVPFIANLVKDEKIVIVSPDTGGLKRAELFREALSAYMQRDVSKAFLEKKRSGGQVTGGQDVIGDVKGSTTIIIDDMISTGKTISIAVDALHKQGAKKIWACVSHGLFVGKANKRLTNQHLDKIIISNSVTPFRLDKRLLENKVEIIDISRLFAEVIKRIAEGGAVVDWLEAFSKI